MALLQSSIDSQSWATKAQSAAAMSTVAEKLKDKLGPPHLGNLLSTLLAGLQGRIWTGKVGNKSSRLYAVYITCKVIGQIKTISFDSGQFSVRQPRAGPGVKRIGLQQR